MDESSKNLGEVLTCLRSTVSEVRPEALIVMEAHRENLPSTGETVEYFNISVKRNLLFKMNM